jgi:hypothetical protein
MELMIDEEKFYQIIKKAVSEAIEENLIKLKLSMIPYVEDEEMEELEGIFGDPEKYKDQQFVKLDL